MRRGSEAWSEADVIVRMLRLFVLLAGLLHIPLHAAEQLHITVAEELSTPGQAYAAAPYEIDEQLLPEHWIRVSLPHILPRPVVAGWSADPTQAPTTAITWYRIRLPKAEPGHATRYLYIPRWKADGRIAVYSDQRLLYQSHANIDWNGWNIPLWIPLDDAENTPEVQTLLIRLEHPRDGGGGISSFWIGEDQQIGWRYRTRYFLQVQLPYTSSAAFLAIGLFSFLVWLRLREKTYLLFFCVSLASFLRTLHYHVGEIALPVSDEWFSWLTINSLYWILLVTHFFLIHLHNRSTAWLNRAVVAITVVIAVITLPCMPGTLDSYAMAPLAYAMLLITGTSLAIINMVQSRRAATRDGMLLSAWAMVGMFLGVYDFFLQINYIQPEAVYLGPYSNIGAFLIFIYIIYHRYLDAIGAVRRANLELKKRLREREEELKASHQRLREIELRQTLNEERQRLMQDMHDGMGSSLVTALLVVESGQSKPDMIADVLKNCIDDLKLTIDSMEPVQADLLLLLATLRFRLGPRLEHAGIALLWEVSDVPDMEWIDPRNGLHILRILQEAFTNIIKHSGATEIRVATAVDSDWVTVRIADNGRGFSVAGNIGNHGKGLANQQRRAASIGAQIAWTSDSCGTVLTLRLPILNHSTRTNSTFSSTF